jgi:hypothetical protein
MEKYALLARLEAKVGKKTKLLHFLKCFAVSTRQPDTVNWYGLQMGPSTFGILILLKLRR